MYLKNSIFKLHQRFNIEFSFSDIARKSEYNSTKCQTKWKNIRTFSFLHKANFFSYFDFLFSFILTDINPRKWDFSRLKELSLCHKLHLAQHSISLLKCMFEHVGWNFLDLLRKHDSISDLWENTWSYQAQYKKIKKPWNRKRRNILLFSFCYCLLSNRQFQCDVKNDVMPTKYDSKQTVAVIVFLNINWFKVYFKIIIIFLRTQDAFIIFLTIYFTTIIKKLKIMTICLESVW